MNAATGGHTSRLAKVDLEIFLDAAHGDEFSHATMKAREKALARPVRHPQEQVQPPQGLHIEDTNVHIMFLQQDCIFTDYWAQMASRKAVGLAQRCLFSFGGNMDPAPVDLSTFKDLVMEPLIRNFFPPRGSECRAEGHEGTRVPNHGRARCRGGRAGKPREATLLPL